MCRIPWLHWSIFQLLFHFAFIATIYAFTKEQTDNRISKFLPNYPRIERTSVDECMDGKTAKYCTPKFEDIAIGKEFQTTQTCGARGPERYCERTGDKSPWACSFCDSSQKKISHPVTFLNDQAETDAKRTCWLSGRVITTSQQIHNEDDLINTKTENVTLSIDFAHPYEISFILLNFCGPMPAAMVIYKSNGDDNWQPYQYYADDCKKRFNVEPGEQISHLNEEQALCSEQFTGTREPWNYENGSRVSFNTNKNRPRGVQSPVLQNWMTARAIRIDLIRPSVWPAASTGLKTPNTTLVDAYQYAISEIKIGAYCQCNGHADRCILKDGKPACDCKHGTEGETCNQCKPFYHDRPWRRGLKNTPNECKACECNLHARKCKFSQDVYEIGGESGGLCFGCRHNTAGKSCQYCKAGYTPDKNKQKTHRRYCKETTDDCSSGFNATTELPRPTDPTDPTPTPPTCHSRCTANRQRYTLHVRRFCKKLYIVKAEITKRLTHQKNWVIYQANLKLVYKPGRSKKPSRSKNLYQFSSRESSRDSRESSRQSSRKKDLPVIKRGAYNIWVRKEDDRCNCPKLRVKKTYLMMGRHRHVSKKFPHQENAFAIDQKTIALRWREQFDSKLRSIERKAKKQCRNFD